jgi:hypothetical protein
MNEQTELNNTTEATPVQESLDWLQKDKDSLPKAGTGDRLPSMKLETGKIIKFTVLVDKPFEEYLDLEKSIVKKIIPVLHNGDKKLLWLNKKNPLYKQLIDQILTGKREFYISTTGSQDSTRYEIQEFD